MVEITRYLARSWKPLHALPIHAITRSDINNTLNNLARNNGKVTADSARVALSGLCSWAIQWEYLAANPTAEIASRAKNGSRKRVLSEAELGEIWRASDPVPNRSFCRYRPSRLLTRVKRGICPALRSGPQRSDRLSHSKLAAQ